MFDIISRKSYTIQGEMAFGGLFLHLKDGVRNWNKTIYKDLVYDVGLILEDAKEKGHLRVFVLVPLSDEKLIRFEKMMGFVPVGVHTTPSGDAVLLMQQET